MKDMKKETMMSKLDTTDLRKVRRTAYNSTFAIGKKGKQLDDFDLLIGAKDNIIFLWN